MKYYKVIKENFLWEVGAILENSINNNCKDGKGYTVTDPIFRKHEDSSEYISANIIETTPDYFQRVYKVDLVTRVLYEVKDKAMEMLKDQFKS